MATLLYHDEFPGRAVFDTAVSHAMLRRVAAGATPESLRLYRPDPVLLFSSMDARRRGFERAVEIARNAGFHSAIRLAGGHAAVFLEESMAFAWATADGNARNHIRPRFEHLTDIIVRTLERLGLDARVGEIPGEYCPGDYSVNVEGRLKVMGVGQRVIRGGAHVGGVLTVGQTTRLRSVLIPVYEALELDFVPETAGGIADIDPSIGVADVLAAMQETLRIDGVILSSARFDDATLTAAEALVPMHVATPRAAAANRQGLSKVSSKTLVHADRLAARSRRVED